MSCLLYHFLFFTATKNRVGLPLLDDMFRFLIFLSKQHVCCLLQLSSFLISLVSTLLVIDTLYRINRKQAVAVTVKEDSFHSPDLKPGFGASLWIELYHLHPIGGNCCHKGNVWYLRSVELSL